MVIQSKGCRNQHFCEKRYSNNLSQTYSVLALKDETGNKRRQRNYEIRVEFSSLPGSETNKVSRQLPREASTAHLLKTLKSVHNKQCNFRFHKTFEVVIKRHLHRTRLCRIIRAEIHSRLRPFIPGLTYA